MKIIKSEITKTPCFEVIMRSTTEVAATFEAAENAG